MTDRKTGNPGQYKAKMSLEEVEKLQRGEHFTIVLERDDQPITEGTPYNKASVLPDELAALICPDIEDPTPAEALYALNARSVALDDRVDALDDRVDALDARSVTLDDRVDALDARSAYESPQYPGCYYHIVNGVTEWVNPPMVEGVEYRTDKRYNRKVVYTKLIKTATLLNASVSLDIEGNIVSFRGNAITNNGKTIDTFPMFGSSGKLMVVVYIHDGKIMICNVGGTDVSMYSAVFTVEYTK